MDFPLDLHHRLVAQQLNPPAIVEYAQSPAPNCTYQRAIKRGPFIFPISIEEAKKLFPSDDGLERIVSIQEKEGVLSFAFFKYQGSSNGWDIVVVYRDFDGAVAKVYSVKGKSEYIPEKEVHISEPHDIAFVLGQNNEIIDGEINLGRLKGYILHSYYTCNAGERTIFDSLFKKHMEGVKNKKQAVPKIKKKN